MRCSPAAATTGDPAAVALDGLETPLDTLLLVKLLLVPALIALLTLAGRRYGAGVAGWLSALPILSGPILWILAVEQGPAFAATAAHGTLLAVLALLVYSLSYAWMAQRRHWPHCLVMALACYGLTVVGLREVQASLTLSLVTVLFALTLAPIAFPRIPACVRERSSGKDLPWRMLAAVSLVLVLSASAQTLGPRLAGLLATFPVISTVLVAFTHRESGGQVAIRMLRGVLYGYYAFAVFCAVLAYALQTLPISGAFALASVAALMVHAGVRPFMPRSA
ncbi:MAG: hypothetical protein U1F26_06545 [Lysobacterales bacterium]